MLTSNYLLLLLLIPFVSALLVPALGARVVNAVSIAIAGLYFLVVLMGWNSWNLRFSADWYEPLGLKYSLYLDSYSYLLILLSSFLTILCLLYSWRVVEAKQKAYHSLFHFLQATVVACLLSEDLVFFYVFWEAMLIPMYFIIGIWGGPRRLYAAMKFFLFTFSGSILMLIGLICLYVFFYQQTGTWTTSFEVLREHFQSNPLPFYIEQLIFLSFLLSFAIKVPLFPFHTWLPDAHVEAPTAGSVILAGVLLKMGTYGLMRFAIPLFPAAAASFATPLSVLSVIGIILGALVAWRQSDIKKLIAYSSVSHLGFVTLGIFALTETSWNGAFLQMINHGITTGALFLLVGFIYDQKHSRNIERFGGLAKQLPRFSLIFIIMSLSSVGLPGTNGFVGEFMILLGSFQSEVISKLWVVLASTGVILSAIYTLHLVQKLCFGKPAEDNSFMKDIGWKEYVLYVPFIILVFVIGLYPKWIVAPIHETTSAIFNLMPNGMR